MPAARHTRRFTSSPLPLARSRMPSPPAVEEAPSWLSQGAGTSNAQADHTLHLCRQCYAAFRRAHHSMRQSQWHAGDCSSRSSSYAFHHHEARRQNGVRTCPRLASLHYWLVNAHANQSRLLATRIISMRALHHPPFCSQQFKPAWSVSRKLTFFLHDGGPRDSCSYDDATRAYG
ncbi:hypothetical protein F5148DRAFT_327540 [Russula earlei]|uniref:Uncharacterized protein n=1 Tax=Russula earlei TaxID=71964 RepID=A0ACC0UIX8_9AGAM|nr:hypothetical protein F5148DRAFT_327540 [Russula earlei]